jgi:Holliday junction DNA helicase RuvA
VIGRLTGSVAEIDEDEVLIDVAGVGYVVRCASRTLASLGAVGQVRQLHIETQFSAEGGARLYGFSSRADRAFFRLLLTIQGVGPKAALALLDVLSPADALAAAAREDRAAFGRAAGVGPKLAARLVTELKGKAFGAMGLAATGLAGAEPAEAAAPTISAVGEAVAALMGLGIGEPQARRSVETAHRRLDQEAPLALLIKTALQEVGR